MACVFCDGTLVAFETPIFSYTMDTDFHIFRPYWSMFDPNVDPVSNIE